MKLNNIKTLLLITCCFLISCYNYKQANKQDNNSNKNQLNQEKKVYKNQIIEPNIKTLLSRNNNDIIISTPIIRLNSEDIIKISFDDLDADIKDYTFTIMHCNSEWQSSNLLQSEYITGFTQEHITNYEFSFNTIQKYTHYNFTFPNNNIAPIISGNYVLIVYESEEEVLYKRFMVLDNKVTINAEVRRATLANIRNTKHEIDFTIQHDNLYIPDPFSDLKVKIKQNNREDNTISNLTPIFIKNNKIIYDYEDENTFWGNNEFRYFDIRSLRYQSERIKNITYDSTYNNVYLLKDNMRTFDQYSINPDINGKFIIHCQEAWKSETEADYAFVHFKLNSHIISYGDIYIIGGLSDWEIKDKFKLEYNYKENIYETKIYMKQGYYNYHYAIKDSTTNKVNTILTEGTHYQTRNDYYIYIYYRSSGDRYDSFIGFLKTSSKELF